MADFIEFHFTSSTGVNTIRAIKVYPQSTPKAIIQIAHGVADHIDRYRDFMAFLAEKGYITGRIAPIIVDGIQSPEKYINPIPSGLVLTGIVVSVSVTALMLSLTMRLYKRYGTLDLDEISAELRKEGR